MNRDEYGQWLNDRDWTHFVTITTPYQAKESGLRRMMRNVYTRIRKKFKGTEMFWVSEKGSSRSNPHTHALINTKGVSENRIRDICKQMTGQSKSRIDVQPYDPLRGASNYITKEMFTNNNDYDLHI